MVGLSEKTMSRKSEGASKENSPSIPLHPLRFRGLMDFFVGVFSRFSLVHLHP